MEKQAVIKLMNEAYSAEKEGLLIGYANLYDVEDLQGDISARGSFTKTVSERQHKMKIYRNHDFNQFVGVPIEMDTTDQIGLRLTAKMAMETDMGRNAFLEAKFLSENGFQSGFSIGGWVMKRDKSNSKIVTEYKLNEISILTTDPANEQSMVEIVKSLNEINEMKADEFWSIIEKAYNEKFTDNILKSLEQHLTLKNDTEQLEATNQILKPTDIEIEIWKQLLNK